MKVVIDTNIVISAVLKDRDPEAIIRFVIAHPHYEWIASRDIITEYTDVLRRPKFRLPVELMHDWSELFETMIRVVDVGITVDFPRDPKRCEILGVCTRCRSRLSHYR